MITTPPLFRTHDAGEPAGGHRHLSALAQITSTLFNPDAFPLERLEAARVMFRLYSELTGIDDKALGTEETIKTWLPSGMAVAPRVAARCVLDYVRTTQFLRGLDAAIAEARNRFPGTIIEVLYAGCGPFATLALPLCTRFTPEEVRFTLIDIHQRSIDSARAAVEQLGLSAYIRDYICADAATYRHPDGDDIHVAVAEVMQSALAREPQFAVTANLAPQLAPGGIFIPQHIGIDLALVDTRVHADMFVGADAGEDAGRTNGSLDTGEPIILHRLLDLTSETAPVLMAQGVASEASDTLALPAVSVPVPDLPSASDYTVAILTTIEVFSTIGIGYRESGLTLPTIPGTLDAPRGGEVIEARYVLGQAPGFQLRYAVAEEG